MRNPRQWWRDRRAERDARDECLVAGALWHAAPLSGWPLMWMTKLHGGRLYAALIRMERDGRVTSWWQPGPRPRRRFYRLGAAPIADLPGRVADVLGRARGSEPGA